MVYYGMSELGLSRAAAVRYAQLCELFPSLALMFSEPV